jgi:hypothetical protein
MALNLRFQDRAINRPVVGRNNAGAKPKAKPVPLRPYSSLCVGSSWLLLTVKKSKSNVVPQRAALQHSIEPGE